MTMNPKQYRRPMRPRRSIVIVLLKRSYIDKGVKLLLKKENLA